MKLKKTTLPIQTPFNMKKYLKNCFYFAPLVFALPATAATTASDDFSSLLLNGGSGDWNNSWTNATSNVSMTTSAATGALVATTTNTTAITGSNPNGTVGVASVSRQYTANTLDLLTISFDFTIGSFPTAGATAPGTVGQDRFELFGGSNRQGGFSPSASWMILGGEDLTGLKAGLGANWIFHDGEAENTNFINADLVDSGIALVVGDTYRFTILDDPSTGTYIASVGNLADMAGAFTTGSLGYRGTAGADPHIHFGARLSNRDDTAGFTVDNVSIVPEPSSLLLSSIGIIALFRRRRA